MKRRSNESLEEYRKRARDYERDRRNKRMAQAREKLGGVCVRCGKSEDLDFDHIDPATKIKDISYMTRRSEETFWAEVVKCQLLCKTCHAEKSFEDGSNPRRKHGTRSMYAAHGCRCGKCTKAHREYMRMYMREYTSLSANG